MSHTEGKSKVIAVLLRSLSCLGIVWGDIGTSPLYTYSSIYNCDEVCEVPSLDDIKGTLSCVIWALTFVAFLKYIIVALQMDYHGEGGGFAMALNINRKFSRPISSTMKAFFITVSCIGGGGLVADSLITPALSVLSAVEGLQQSSYFDASQADTVGKLIVPLTVLILLGVYGLQSFGSTKVGRVFGPIMVVYFGSIAGVGLYNLFTTGHWEVLEAISPHYALLFFVSGRFSGYQAFKKLSSIVLAITGAEAVYADLGHFGKLPIYLSWAVVYPTLILAYSGQAANMLANPQSVTSSFWLAVPTAYYAPMLIIATLATVVASQAMITGCFSLLSQAVALNLFPKVKVVNTDPTKFGQIYIPEINILLGFGSIVLVLVFQSANALAGAYGIAVVMTFCTTSVLMAGVLYYCNWPNSSWVFPVLAVLPFMSADLLFLSSNLYFKFTQGGWVTAMLAVIITSVMLCWRFGRRATNKSRDTESFAMSQQGLPATFHSLADALRAGTVKRGNGMGVYLSPNPLFVGKRVALSTILNNNSDVRHQVSAGASSYMNRLMSGISTIVPGQDVKLPNTLALYLKITGCIQRIVIILHVHFDYDRPRLNINERVVIEEISSDNELGKIYSATVTFGFAEPLSEVDMNKIVRQWVLAQIPRSIPVDDLFQPAMPGEDEQLYYFLNKEDLLCKRGSNIFRRILVSMYSALHGISRSAYVFLNLPRNEVVQLGDVIAI